MIHINLLPVREERRKADMRQFSVLLAASLIGAIAILGVFHVKIRSDLSSAKQSLQETQAEIDSYQVQIQKVDEYRATKERIEKKLSVIERLERSRSGPVHVMDELAIHTPERLWLTRVSSREGAVTIEGMSLDNELVALFLTSLDRSPYFTSVELQETKATEVEGLKLNEFKLNASITDPGDESGTAAIGSGTPVAMGR